MIARLYMVAALMLSGNAQAESSCTFCGDWVPTAGLYGSKYVRGMATKIAGAAIGIPGCSVARAKQVHYKESVGQYAAPPITPLDNPAIAISVLEQKPRCETHALDVQSGARIKVQLRPRQMRGWEELVLTVYEAGSTEDVIRAGEVIEYLPTPPGQLQKVRRRPSPTPLAEWWFVRKGHNPCDE